jgi:hypothetical protein
MICNGIVGVLIQKLADGPKTALFFFIRKNAPLNCETIKVGRFVILPFYVHVGSKF